ncbi:hypothetical protein CVD28_02745 [Bacillus sp. M6-12]|uniref:hypothetical protein n=1 Tax=Bacillus sp. M6-12 TaxID=2054166 RepID=UPI000C78C39A|nr:hypothetical protein [Bacillus sp. M6-12]PLS19350.1 hypothetical protein CVD28_02745 [Bacillus sp. M6-12]
MDYRGMVEVVKQVTGLDVPVYFSDMEANCIGSPYFGIGNHSIDIWDEVGEDLFDDPMFELTDFIENKHLKYYHVGLPDKIMKKDDDFLYTVTEEQLRENGIAITLTRPLLETFVILHEFGHAHELFVSYEGNVEKYLQETTEENNHTSYQIRAYGLGGTEKGLRLHKSTATEKYADAFAIQHFQKVIKIGIEQHLF